ncbi:hypothetical protein MLD38_010162 [Melastoma candidum]|uniref:Uncharacterized protein n=1 Tax=Melastoma candidum TaxID=119954 RepID=A0ACB9QYI3_9MYRT|nr:hypothetical protein MLD38_010162 [Melastoma candidum]
MKPPHAVCIPFQAQSHITAMLKLAKILHHRGFFITFVNSEFNHRRLLHSGGLTAIDSLPDWKFVSIPDGLPPSDADATQDIRALCDSARFYMEQHFSELVLKLNEDASTDVPPITHIVGDANMNYSVRPAAEKFGIPLVQLFPIAACAMLAFKHYRLFIDRCLKPLKGKPGIPDIKASR